MRLLDLRGAHDPTRLDALHFRLVKILSFAPLITIIDCKGLLAKRLLVTQFPRPALLLVLPDGPAQLVVDLRALVHALVLGGVVQVRGVYEVARLVLLARQIGLGLPLNHIYDPVIGIATTGVPCRFAAVRVSDRRRHRVALG